MKITITEILFSILSFWVLFSAFKVITSKNVIYSVLWLVVTFLGISGHYIMLNAQFLAIVNVIVYAGAIMVLFLFVVMLMNAAEPDYDPRRLWWYIFSIATGTSLLLVMVAAINHPELDKLHIELWDGNVGLSEHLGNVLFTTYLIPFELSSILFLVAIVGSVIISKKSV